MSRSCMEILLTLLGLHFVLGNVEKVIFLGPGSLRVPTTLEELRIPALSPEQSTLRTELPSEFPTISAPKGQSSWISLEGLTHGQRYEVRVCWAATQPTSFRMSTYELSEVLQSPELITSLANSSQIQKSQAELLLGSAQGISRSESLRSVLFLQIFAAADYYTANRTLMENVSPVLVDIILDRFIFNILPRSLVPTAGYLLIIAVCSWYIANLITSWLQMVARAGQQKKDV